jgi:dinuclear metal center YbgI/SA1388 family protein
MQVRDILQTLDTAYPLSRAANWDKVGLQVGDGSATVSRVLVAHEINDEVLAEAEGCQAIVIYHPLIFRALENLNFQNHTVRLAGQCIAKGLNVIALHTALDHAPQPQALGDKLAQSLGLQDVRVLQPDGHDVLVKIMVFVPDENLRAVQDAMWQAGAGQIGNYDCASFRSRGTGTFRPNEQANPHIGKQGELEQVEEWRLEVIAPQSSQNQIVAAMKAAHPYEEVAYDVIALQNRGEGYGASRVGTLPQPLSLRDYAALVEQGLQPPSVRLVEGKSQVQKIACVPGSGASYIAAAVRAGCDCLVTGDIKHHDALQAKASNLSIIDVTHTATERATIGMLAAALEKLDVEVVRSRVETNPFVA